MGGELWASDFPFERLLFGSEEGLVQGSPWVMHHESFCAHPSWIALSKIVKQGKRR
jgi:hypothetical protein